ncbi:hypothetical protein HPP92_017205 [Vanilla planifolia]|uniref:Uncharacterized protein n=1 Tax=Vanilla planifolia TaxID=51239 RepID=A0A835QH92_VANPL|nr:hypothetical protein HPP92_017205 [Vanilla planifolia]
MACESDAQNPSYMFEAAFRAMEPVSFFISLAKQTGGGSLTEEIQSIILNIVIETSMQSGIRCNHTYVKNLLKKVIVAAESNYNIVVEGLYEQFANIALVQDNVNSDDNNRIFKMISFLFPCYAMNLHVHLHCSLNMLEGDTGCALWPSSLLLSEVILSYPKLFKDKVCFEVGSGVGLVGIALAHVGASKIILTDGDTSSIKNMKYNLELNHLNSEKVSCKYLPWESASESELTYCNPDFLLGADIIYDPKCLPHLVRVLCILLKQKKQFVFKSADTHQEIALQCDDRKEDLVLEELDAPVAYIANVIRNKETFDNFLLLAEEAQLSVMDITEKRRPMNLLPYMLSFDRKSVRLLRVLYKSE